MRFIFICTICLKFVFNSPAPTGDAAGPKKRLVYKKLPTKSSTTGSTTDQTTKSPDRVKVVYDLDDFNSDSD